MDLYQKTAHYFLSKTCSSSHNSIFVEDVRIHSVSIPVSHIGNLGATLHHTYPFSFCHFCPIQLGFKSCWLYHLFIRSTFPGSSLTRTIESFSIRIDGSTISIHSHCLQICAPRKVIPRAACQFTIFFCWLRLLFQMSILGIRHAAERIAYVWARCSSASDSFLLG